MGGLKLLDIVTELLSIPPLTYLIVALAVTAAGLLQATVGIGFGLIASPILVLIDPGFVPGAILMTGLSVTGLTSLRELQQVNWPLLSAGICGRIPGALIGAYLTAFLATEWFGIFFGLSILLAVFISILTPKVKATALTLVTAGTISGFMGTITSVGAPPVAIVMQNQPGPEMRSTTSGFLFFGAIISIGSLFLFGRFGLEDLVRSAMIVPFCLIGFWLSGPLIKLKQFQTQLRPMALSVCALMSLLLLYRSVSSIL